MKMSQKLARRGPRPQPAAARAAVGQERLNELAVKIGRGKSIRKPTVWPGGTWPLELEVLSAGQRKEADAAAASAIRSLYEDDSQVRVADLAEAHGLERMVQYLWRALFDAESKERAFATAEELGQVAKESELLALYAEYDRHRDETDPDPDELDEAVFEELLSAIKKKDQTHWRRIASGLRPSSLLTLVDRLASSWTDSSSSTPS